METLVTLLGLAAFGFVVFVVIILAAVLGASYKDGNDKNINKED